MDRESGLVWTSLSLSPIDMQLAGGAEQVFGNMGQHPGSLDRGGHLNHLPGQSKEHNQRGEKSQG